MSIKRREKRFSPLAKEGRNIMAEKKLSRPVVLAYVLDNFGDEMPAEYRAVAEAWLAKLTAPKAATGPTKAQMENAAMIDRMIETMETHDQPVTARWVLENVAGVLTIQKASSLLRVAVKAGRVIADNTKKTTEYSVA